MLRQEKIRSEIEVDVLNTDNKSIAKKVVNENDKTIYVPDTPYDIRDQDNVSIATGNLKSGVGGRIPVAVVGLTPIAVDADIKDRFGLQMPLVNLTPGVPSVDFSEYDFTALALSREVSWGGFDSDLQAYYNSLITANIRSKFIASYPCVGGTFDCHKWNFVYPLDHNAANRLVFAGAMSHSALGLANLGGFCWAFSNINMQSYTNTYDLAFGLTITSNFSGAHNNNTLMESRDNIDLSASLAVNIVTGVITFGLFGASATYTLPSIPGSFAGYRFVVKRDGSNLKLFINGSLVATTAVTFKLYSSGFPQNNTFILGGNGYINSAANTTFGNIFFATDLTDAEVIANDGFIDTLETAVGR